MALCGDFQSDVLQLLSASQREPRIGIVLFNLGQWPRTGTRVQLCLCPERRQGTRAGMEALPGEAPTKPPSVSLCEEPIVGRRARGPGCLMSVCGASGSFAVYSPRGPGVSASELGTEAATEEASRSTREVASRRCPVLSHFLSHSGPR